MCRFSQSLRETRASRSASSNSTLRRARNSYSTLPNAERMMAKQGQRWVIITVGSDRYGFVNDKNEEKTAKPPTENHERRAGDDVIKKHPDRDESASSLERAEFELASEARMREDERRGEDRMRMMMA